MHYRTYRTPAVVAAMLTAFGLVAPAQADTTTTQTTTTEVTTLGAPATVVTPAGVTTTTTVGTVPVTGTAGGTVYFRTAKPEVLLLTITARRKDLDKMIDSAHAKGSQGYESRAQENRARNWKQYHHL
jgi:hypothetical protein